MSTIGKSTDAKNDKPLATLQAEYAEVKNEIRAVLAAKPDRKNLDEADKSKLRQLYLRAAELANILAGRANSTELADGYRSDYKKLSEAAASYGSAIKGAIPTTTFDDVKGLDEVKALIKTFMFLAKSQDVIKHYRIDGGLGMLMYGPPGTGKTMVAEAIANAMRLPLFIITPADIFKSYVGESEQAVKAIFDELEACREGAILFVDECESIFSRRSQDTKDYKAAVTTELLQRINGFGVDGSKRIMVAATNRPDAIDPAYLRFKRFSHLLYIPLPDPIAIAAIINKRLRGIPLEGISEFEIVEMATKPDAALYSAADICSICEKACLSAIEKMQAMGTLNPIPLTREMFMDAFQKVKPQLTRADLRLYEDFKDNALK